VGSHSKRRCERAPPAGSCGSGRTLSSGRRPVARTKAAAFTLGCHHCGASRSPMRGRARRSAMVPPPSSTVHLDLSAPILGGLKRLTGRRQNFMGGSAGNSKRLAPARRSRRPRASSGRCTRPRSPPGTRAARPVAGRGHASRLNDIDACHSQPFRSVGTDQRRLPALGQLAHARLVAAGHDAPGVETG
jgi:hypothetical protein